jgi:hypothetical protein
MYRLPYIFTVGELLLNVSAPPEPIITVSVGVALVPTVQAVFSVMAWLIVHVSPGVRKVDGAVEPLVQLERVVTAPAPRVNHAVASALLNVQHSSNAMPAVKPALRHNLVNTLLKGSFVFFMFLVFSDQNREIARSGMLKLPIICAPLPPKCAFLFLFAVLTGIFKLLVY